VRPTFQPGNPVPQIGKPVLLPGAHEPVPLPNILLAMFLLCSHPKLSQIHAPVAVNSVEKGVALMVEEGLVKVPKGSQTCMISSGFGMPAPSRLKASPPSA
jgi:hypothetical protein